MAKKKVLSPIGFRIGGEDWTLKFGDTKEADGITELASRTIHVRYDLRGSTLRDVLLHELYEAAVYTAGCVYCRDYPDTQDIYIMNHTQMTNIMSSVRTAYDDVVEVLGKSALINS